MGEEERLARKLRNMDRQDRIEQKLGIDRTMTKMRDNRALREIEKMEKKKGK